MGITADELVNRLTNEPYCKVLPHFLLFGKNFQTKSSHFNRNLCDLEISEKVSFAESDLYVSCALRHQRSWDNQSLHLECFALKTNFI